MAAKHKLSLSVQYPDPRLKENLPRPLLRKAIQAALFAPAELTLRFVDAEEGQTLNRDYRGKDYATNVLTFAYTEDEDAEVTQADIIFCTDVLLSEAQQQKKSVEEHAVHLVVHGVLHAQGYDHETDEEAEEMEALEIEILADLGWPNPYL
ncbi:rRNA maturation RNase YbeY [Undibacterium sp. RTI2.1]|uniref:rRNA maturation RNase YbeY n=1 Tax=unclassified Undibacterium TaxID=2630295 RepID=UPI002AB454D0|nr:MULTISPECIES: rRNA maturation RNase YbeY [unclassified Undibacterium]MDY7539046.1 rRNA maturation RNase YbeY [Undibacterium sp. 5I1]MEB0032443.1 rRNA maturation RNase YbeY [Undibacterium sp. RTI2.1]MEB0115876.1 rRNA maturation RNase YbeY [Undibacterium sp. RTI2.2]MEB0229820.1 rRNA maturation RNase YbeY [Undibacterium sp. 10I3]MEB0258275.1 rRNA maturation RNase YbeY [Undibacterium sp. 5I1]